MEKFNNQTLKNAVEEWFNNEKLAESKYGHISNWDTSEVTDMSSLFLDAETFNEPLNNWDVSSVISMERMFNNAKLFNQSLKDWDVSNVTDMSNMFAYAESFNQPVGDWDVSKATCMYGMFYNAESFNQPLNNWNTSNFTNTSRMFWGALSFNQPIGDWNVGNVMYMTEMFYKALAFNQDTSSWDANEYQNSIVREFYKNIDMAFDSFLEHNPAIEIICDEETMTQWYDFVKWSYTNNPLGVEEWSEGDIVTKGSYTFKISSLMESIVWACVNWYDNTRAEEEARNLTCELLIARASEVSGKVCGECGGDDYYCKKCYGTGFDVYDKDIDWVYYDEAHRPGVYTWDDIKYDEIHWLHYEDALSKIFNSVDTSSFEKLSKINLS